MESSKNKMLVICGPTASGKTSLGIEVAEHIGGEIISMDSRQVYRGLDIGTAKATPDEQDRVRHHLLDVAEPGDRFTAADFAINAEAAVIDIMSRGKVPVIVGGTPLYLSSLLGSFKFCGTDSDPDYRVELNREAEEQGTVVLHERLGRIDPASAERIHPNDLFRIVRALEICHTTGRPASTGRTKNVTAPEQELQGVFSRMKIFCMYLPRESLYERINRRALAMFNEGLVEEIKNLIDRQSDIDGFLRKIIGYSQGLDYIDRRLEFDATVEDAAKKTRHFARRQMTWLRAMGGVTWLNAEAQEPGKLFETVMKEMQ